MKKVEETIGINFNNHLLLKEALTHRSYINENLDWPVSHNERLEFLGDAVLEIVVTKFLFDKYPEFNEGRLTSVRAALVNHNMLLKVAKDVGLDSEIFLSKGEEKGSDKAKEAIFANAVEALIGAIYMDQGYDAAKGFIDKFVLTNLGMVMEKKLYHDPKSLLQEVVQEKLSITPKYEVVGENGPDHDKRFSVGVYFGDKLVAEGEGESKQDAEREAAAKALKTVEK